MQEIRVKATNAQLIKRSSARVEHDARLIRLIASLIATESKSSVTLLSIRLSIGPGGSINNHRSPSLLAGCPGSERLCWRFVFWPLARVSLVCRVTPRILHLAEFIPVPHLVRRDVDVDRVTRIATFRSPRGTCTARSVTAPDDALSLAEENFIWFFLGRFRSQERGSYSILPFTARARLNSESEILLSATESRMRFARSSVEYRDISRNMPEEESYFYE